MCNEWECACVCLAVHSFVSLLWLSVIHTSIGKDVCVCVCVGPFMSEVHLDIATCNDTHWTHSALTMVSMITGNRIGLCDVLFSQITHFMVVSDCFTQKCYTDSEHISRTVVEMCEWHAIVPNTKMTTTNRKNEIPKCLLDKSKRGGACALYIQFNGEWQKCANEKWTKSLSHHNFFAFH